METFLSTLFKKTNPIEDAKKAINNGDLNELKKALENASNDNVAQLLNYAVENHNKNYAVENHNKNTQEIIDILASKIDPNKKDQIINATLGEAFKTENTENTEIIKALLNNLKEPTKESLNNLLEKALKVGNPEIIKQLLDKGAEVSEQNMDELIEIVKSAPNKNSDSFKYIVKLLTEKLTKNTSELLKNLRPAKQNEFNEQLEKKLKQLKELEELKENKEQKAETSPKEQAIEDLMKAVKSIKENKLDDASYHLEQVSNSTGNSDLKKIAGELKDNVNKRQKIENHESIGAFTEKVNSESLGHERGQIIP
ncbi:MAG: hypothetical protein ISP24_03065 [Rickettsiales bacterium]|nr:hypothetical protein [Rickettsiales bacterium]